MTRNADSAVVGQYQYDALSRRVSEDRRSAAGTSATTVVFLRRRAHHRGAEQHWATQATYVYGNYVDEVLTMDRGGQTYYYHQNALWSVEAMTDSTAEPGRALHL